MQEGGAVAMLGDGSELRSNYPPASNATQQQRNVVVQREEVGEAEETVAWNQKKETVIVIPPTPIENQRLNTEKSLLTLVAKKRNRNAEGGTIKKKGLKKIQILSQKEVVDMGRLFVQQYFQLHSNFSGTVDYTQSAGF